MVAKCPQQIIEYTQAPSRIPNNGDSPAQPDPKGPRFAQNWAALPTAAGERGSKAGESAQLDATACSLFSVAKFR
jgi:hypothetical protein